MQITYVNHACLLIETSDGKFATDPWSAGPAYLRQWHPFPKPVCPELVNEADAILISHAHEDHLHEPTLAGLGKDKRVFYPFNWYGGTVDWIKSMGFADVTEAASCRTYRLGPSTRITYLVNGHDSLMVIEGDGETLVNVNDALHSSDPSVIDTYTSYIRSRWPRIDSVFCGFGGASYYPNTLHGPGKDDRMVAWLREQLFTHNFCRIVKQLEPRVAVPFAADFALLADEQQWVNEVRFPREWIPKYFSDQGGSSNIAIMYSGDRLTGGRVEAESPLRDRLADGQGDEALLEEQYPERISALNPGRTATSAQIDELRDKLERNVSEHSAYYDSKRVDGLSFSVRLRDAPEPSFLFVSVKHGKATVERRADASPEAAATIETTSEVLSHCLESDWGGDAMIIGYACDIHVHRAEDVRSGLGKLVTELCVRHPRPKAYARQHPMRVARFLAQTPFALKGRIKEKVSARHGQRSNIVDGAHWLSGSPEEIRRICGLPDLEPPKSIAGR